MLDKSPHPLECGAITQLREKAPRKGEDAHRERLPLSAATR